MGYPLKVKTSRMIVATSIGDAMDDHGVELFQHYHDPATIEAVPVAWLKPYPFEEIKQP